LDYVLRHYRLFIPTLLLIVVGILAGELSDRLANQPIAIGYMTSIVNDINHSLAQVATFISSCCFAGSLLWLFYIYYRIRAALSGRDNNLCSHCCGITMVYYGRHGAYTHCLACGENTNLNY
jgi:hypothetical protein